MKKLLKTLIGGMALAASASALATPVSLGGESPDLQQVINGLYTAAGTPLSNAPDVNLNQWNEWGIFKVEASKGTFATMVIEVAGFADSNTFGVYDINNKSNYLQLFSGADSAGDIVALTVTAGNKFKIGAMEAIFSSSKFGYYITNKNNETFYSHAGHNAGKADHMVAFRGDNDLIKLPDAADAGEWGSSSYILGWEDSPLAGSDRDYQDMVVYVESVTPVPEPATTALIGLAGLGLALSRRRKQGKAA